jgi:hypothetical protein
VCIWSSIFFYTDLDQIYDFTQIQMTASHISSFSSENLYWLTQLDGGLTRVKKEINSDETSIVTSGIQINSPLRNYNFYMTYTADKLLIVGGGREANRKNLPGTFMIYEDGKWTNFNDKAIAKAAGIENCMDFLSVAVDPRDPKHYFVASWGEGVYEFNDTTFVHRYTYNNGTTLESANPTYHPDEYVRVDGLAFDKKNNLYMVNAEAQNPISVYTADKKWYSFYCPDIVRPVPNRLIITRNNQKWVNIFRSDKLGIFVLDDNGTIDDTSDDRQYYSNRFVDQQGTYTQSSLFLCLAEDLNGTVWVGTDNGPISFSSAAQVGEGRCNRIISTDQYGDGYYLMEGQKVKTIAIDGGNRKWMGTETGGVYVVDNTGENLVVENFTTRNSQLISDNIESIAINNKTGEVFIGTNKGLMSYMSDAIEGSPNYSEVYAYPNPVKPVDNNHVIITGLVSNSSVKITDIAGNLINRGTSLGGQYTWNCTDIRGSIVKAGIYLVFAATPAGDQGVVTKIMVIK